MQGSCPNPGFRRGQRLRSGPARRPSRRVPYVREQGNFCQRARIPARAPDAGPRATIVPASSIRELLAFWVGRLLAHYEVAEQVEFELSVLFGESGANTDRLTWPIRNSNSRYGSRKFRRWPGRIESESEPPNLAIEKYAACGVLLASNSQSPVRIREGSTPKTPRNRGVFSDRSRVRARSLCPSRPNGGASRIRTLSTPSSPWRGSREALEGIKRYAELTWISADVPRWRR